METLMPSLSSQEREHVASWAVKTSRTEEWTGAQVLRLMVVAQEAGVGTAPELIQQATEELNHARLYAAFAHKFRDADWCASYCSSRGNFTNAGFTAILRRLDAIPVSHGLETLVPFFTGLFFLDLAGLMTVNVYEESPFRELQDIALTIRSDEGRHVAHGREFLRAQTASAQGRTLLEKAVTEMLPDIDAFFGGDDSPVQRTLQKVGIRKTENSALKAAFRKKIAALLGLG